MNERMTDLEREVWVSIDHEGLRARDVADHLGRSPSTIRSILQRARNKTR